MGEMSRLEANLGPSWGQLGPTRGLRGLKVALKRVKFRRLRLRTYQNCAFRLDLFEYIDEHVIWKWFGAECVQKLLFLHRVGEM